MSKRNEGLHGVGGWLALLVAGMLVLGPLLAIGRTYGEFASAERMYPGLTQLAEWSSFKTVGWVSLLIFCAISIYGGLGLATKRTPDAVSRAKWILWFNYPLSIVVTAMIIPTAMIPGGGKEAAMAIPSLLASLIAVAIWTAYLKRSKRVQNTYGLGDESPVVQVSAAAYQVSGTKNPECAVPTKTDGGQHGLPLPPNRDATKTIPTTDYQATIDKDHVYRQIAEELETGSTDKGLWIRLFAECGGDEKQTKVLYIKQRAVRLIAAERLRLEQTARDKTAQAEKLEQVQREASDIADPRLVAAVLDGNWATVSKLLREGAKPIGDDENGNSLLDLARKRRDKQMIQLLESYGAV